MDPRLAGARLVARRRRRGNDHQWVVGAAPFTDATVSYGMTGWIAEIVIVAGADATEANRQLLRDYLNTKWAIY